MDTMKLLLIGVLLFACTLNIMGGITPKVQWHKGQVNVYKFTSDIAAFDADSAKIQATVKMGLQKMWRKQNGKNLYLLQFRMEDVDIDMKPKDQSRTDEKGIQRTRVESDEYSKKDLKKVFGLPTAFTMSSNGKIYKVYHHNDELPFVTALKKAIMTQIQSKFTDGDREETDSVGSHKTHYEKVEQPDGTVVVRKMFTDKDEKKTRFEPGHKHPYNEREAKIDSETDLVLDREGNIKGSVRHDNVDLGTHSRRSHRGFYHDNQNVPYDEENHPADSQNLSAEEESVLELVRIERPQRNCILPRHVDDESDEGCTWIRPQLTEDEDADLLVSLPSFELDADYKESSLAIENLAEMTQEAEKRHLEQTVNFMALMKFIRKDPENGSAIANLKMYLRHYPNKIKVVKKFFEKVFEKDPKNPFLLVCQSLYASVQNKLAQDFLIDSMRNTELIDHGLHATLTIRKPTDKLIRSIESFEKHEDKYVQQNAYFALADAASRLPRGKAEPIIKRLLKNYEESQTEAEKVHHLLAIGNAGNRVPLQFVKDVIYHPETDQTLVSSAVHALRKRVSEDDDDEVNELIHNIVEDEGLDLLSRAHGIKSQIEREAYTRDGHSVQRWSQLLLDDKTHPLIKQGIVKYLHSVGSDEVGEILDDYNDFLSSDSDIEDDFDEDMVFGRRRGRRRGGIVRRVGNVARRAVKAVGDAAKAVGEAVGDAAKKVAQVKDAFKDIEGMFKAASWKNNKVCLPASSKAGDNMCVYDAKMVNFIGQRGNLGLNSFSRHFEWEKLVGSDKVHLYLGAAFYAGSNACSKNAQYLQFNLFGRAEARAVTFSREHNIFDGHVVFEQKNGGIFNSHVYVKVFSATMINRPLIDANRINRCISNTKPLGSKSINVPAFSFTILVGPFPITFGFGVHFTAKLDAKYGFCNQDASASAGLEPSADLGVSASAQLNILIASAGISLQMDLNYLLYPNVNISGLRCALCAELRSTTSPMHITINGVASCNLVVYKKSWQKKLFGWSVGGEGNKLLYQQCLPFNQWDDDVSLAAQ